MWQCPTNFNNKNKHVTLSHKNNKFKDQQAHLIYIFGQKCKQLLNT